MAAPKKVDIGSLLKANNKAGTKKTDVPEVSDHEDQADAVANAYTEFKNAEAAFRAVEGEFLLKSNKVYEKHATDGEFAKSFNFPGAATTGVQVTYQDRFTTIPLEAEPELKQLLGGEYDRCFEQRRVISLEKTDDDTITMLIEKLGMETFQAVFKLAVTVAPKGDMDRKQFELPVQARAFLKQYKASVKLLKE